MYEHYIIRNHAYVKKKKKETIFLLRLVFFRDRSRLNSLSLSLSLCSDRFSTVIARVPRITSYTHSSLLHFIFVDAFNKAGELCYRKVQDRREDGD